MKNSLPLAIERLGRPVQLIVERLLSPEHDGSPQNFADLRILTDAVDDLLLAEAPHARLFPKNVRAVVISGILEDKLGDQYVPGPSSLAADEEGFGGLANTVFYPIEERELDSVGFRGLTVKYKDDVSLTEAVSCLRENLGERIDLAPFPSLPRVLTVRLASTEKPLASEAWEASRALLASEKFAYAEPNFALPAIVESDGAEILSLGPGDWDRNHPATEKAFEWSLDRINARAFWSHNQGSQGDGVTIGHIDTGYTLHPELKSNLDRNRDYDFWDDDADAQDPLKESVFDKWRARFPVLNPGHGTGTGSVIVSPVGKQATTAGEGWVTGTAPKAKLIPYRATPSVVIIPVGSQDEIARALVSAADAGVDVISMSLGSPWGSAVLLESVEYALNSGVILCAAAGNIVAEFIQGDRVTYPARYAGVVAVAGCDYDYVPWGRSCRGTEVDITAPGTDVWRAVATNDLKSAVVERGSGTSFAVATVAGMAACWIGLHGGREALLRHYEDPRLIPAAFLLSLRRHDKIPLRNGDSTLFGGGVINGDSLASLELPDPIDVRDALSEFLPAAPNSLDLLESIAPSEVGVEAIETVFEQSTGLSLNALTESEVAEFTTHLACRPALRAQWDAALRQLTQPYVPILLGQPPLKSLGAAASAGLSRTLAAKMPFSPSSVVESAIGLAAALPEAMPLEHFHASLEAAGPVAKPVVIYTMHEYERDWVWGIVRDPAEQATDSFLLAKATDDQIRQLKEKGLVIEEVEMGDMQDLPSWREESAALMATGDASLPAKFLMRMTGPMLTSRLEQLHAYGLSILELMPDGRYRVEASLDAINELVDAQVGFVTEIVPEVSAALRAVQIPAPVGIFAMAEGMEGMATGEQDSGVQVPYDIWLKQGVDSHELADELREKGYVVIDAAGRKIRLLTAPGSARQRAVEQLPGVEIMEEYVEPVLHNTYARRLLGLDPSLTMPATLFPWTGRGEIIAVADTGLDSGHPDFQSQGKLHTVVPVGKRGTSDDPHGHGTHVAASALGDGSGSAGRFAGMAPGAQLYFQSVLGTPSFSTPYPLDLPPALSALFKPPYDTGARIHNNSWGVIASSYYRLSSREVDDFVKEFPDMLIVISAGNEGTTCDPKPPQQRRSGIGFVDWYSLSAPATSKNALTVGASQSDIPSGGYSSLTHNAVWPRKFPLGNSPSDVATQKVSGAPSEVAGFSSRGTTGSIQIKPDVVAPGTDIVSAKSSLAPSHHFSGPLTGNIHYAHMCGTSMAAPLVSGCAAVAREYFRVERNHRPSAALIKAALINGTDQLNGVHSMAYPGGFPNGHQGFGRINMRMSLPHPAFEEFDLFFYDNWERGGHLAMGERQRFTFELSANTPWLRLCLAYTDIPGDGVQNKLILLLHHVPTNIKWAGNEGQLAALAPMLPSPDRNNNVAIVRIPNPPQGTYWVQVSAANLPQGGKQDFALVVTAPTLGGVKTMTLNG